MTDLPRPLSLSSAAAVVTPAGPDARACWNLVTRAIEAGWVDASDLVDIAAAVSQGNDRGYDEFFVQPYGDETEVSFLDEVYRCATDDLVTTLRRTVALADGRP